MANDSREIRNLVVVLGDQLNEDSPALRGFDRRQDAVWMTETAAEAEHVWNHQARIAMFLAAMRHFRESLRRQRFDVRYRELPSRPGDEGPDLGLVEWLARDLAELRPRRVLLVEPGEWRLKQALLDLQADSDVEFEMLEDEHFLATHDDFRRHADGRKQLRMEFFYREMRKRHRVLMDGEQPLGGRWNYDEENRGAFGKQGPRDLPAPLSFPPDALTRDVLNLVRGRFGDHPGSLDHFDWPVTPQDAEAALQDFIEHRLPRFGQFQDAMWTDEPFLYHATISAAMNLKLLNPRTAIAAAEQAHAGGAAPLSSVEGFIRQILGWREYVRGVYWLYMPQYLDRNELHANHPLPDFYWTGETDMHCLRQAIGQTLQYGYAHHIQRLMVTGLFALLLGVEPRQVHQWYLAMYVDAVEWVEAPNTLGMSQYADGGVMASKPYVATGKYIQRMSNYCRQCRFDPAQAVGERACPFTTLYWDFLRRHRNELAENPRMALQVRNLDRKSAAELRELEAAAEAIRRRWS